MVKQPSDFSFDTYPGLDADLEAAYERNVTLGTAEPSEEIAKAGLAAAVHASLEDQKLELGLAPEITRWAQSEMLDMAIAWSKYDQQIGPTPAGLAEFKDINPNADETLMRLYIRKQDFIHRSEGDSGIKTPEGLSVDETMHLAFIPWKVIRDNLGTFDEWVNTMRTTQGLVTQPDFINPGLLKAIKENKPIYRDPDDPSTLMTPVEYLDMKIAMDGDWGVMLTQTSNQAGIEGLKGRSPNQMTTNGTTHLDIIGAHDHVTGDDQMGIFEWLSLTFQQDPRTLSSQDYSWLLANRLPGDNGAARVPYGDFNGGRVKSSLYDADATDDYVRVRLAVL